MFGLRFSRPILTALTLVALAYNTGCTCGSGPYQGEYIDGDVPNSLEGVKFVESEKGAPSVIGCADGQREGFADLKKFPRVAGCVGAWEGARKLRDTATTPKACGDDLKDGVCDVPASLCAEGWHVCGTSGKGQDLVDHLSLTDCDSAGPGRFNAALSHSPNDEIEPCAPISKNTTFPCMMSGLGAEPVCCGQGCKFGACRDAIWKGKTKISVGTTEGCGAVTSARNGGVMCCYDADGNPEPKPTAAVDEKASPSESPPSGSDPAPAKADEAKADSAPPKAEEATKAEVKTSDAPKGDSKKTDAPEKAVP